MEGVKNYVTEKRKFKDAWAFILYVLYYIGCNTWLLIAAKQSDQSLGSVNFKLLGALSISTLSVIGFSFIAFTYFCEFTIKISVIIYPIAKLILMFLFPNPVLIIPGIIGLLVWGFFVYSYWSRIPLIAKVLSYSSGICLKHFLACIFGIILCCTLQILQIVLTFLVLPGLDNKTSSLVIAIVFLNFFWTLSNFNYFFKVYISSIITYHFIDRTGHKSDVFKSSIVNTLYSLGSISFAGLIIAVVQTIRLLVDRERMRDDRERNLFSAIVICVLAVLLSLLADAIEFANEFTMPYIAVHGTDYVSSVKNSFNLITEQSTIALGGMILLDCALGLFSLLMMIINLIVAVSVILPDLKFNFSDKYFIYSFINTLVGVMIVYFVTMSLFISSYLALIYLHSERPELISMVDQDLAETLKKTTVV